MTHPHSGDILLAYGTGFQFTAAPPADVGSLEKLTGSDPEAVICAVLARAQSGDFGHGHHVVRIMRENDDDWVWSQCATLLAYLGRPVDLDLLVHTFIGEMSSGNAPIIEYIIEILAGSTLIEAVPLIVDLHRRMSRDDRVCYCGVVERLSFMLESGRGPVFKGPERLLLNPDREFWEDPDWSLDFEPYEAMLLARAREVQAVARPHQAFLFGKPLSLPELAEFTLSKVQRNRDSEIVATARMLLEAYTGRDLRQFYRFKEEDSPLDPLAAAALLEDLLENGELDRYEPGVRYFFGHRIPD